MMAVATEQVNFTTAFVDTAGYEELRKHIRESTEFTKELALVLEERAEVEIAYAKLLNKLTVKANKITKLKSGTLCAAWSILCGQFDAEATIHKTAAETIIKDIQKPLKKMSEQQAKSYKVFEAPVDKAVKSMNDSRAELMKKRKSVYSKSKDSQVLVNQASNPNNSKGKPLSDKEMSKLKGKSQKSEEGVAKSEQEYMKQLMLAEKTRQDHEISLVEAASTVQKLEIERINQQKSLLNLYTQTIVNMTPKIKTCCDQINSALSAVQPEDDVIAIAKAKGKPPQPTYQLLMDAYQEEIGNGMSLNQRKTYVARQIKLIDNEIAKEEKKRDDISRNQKNSSVKSTKGVQTGNIHIQIMHCDDNINMLTASKYKLLASIAEMDGKQRPVSGMAQFIRINKDKQGTTVSTLHYPRTNAPERKSTRNISAVPSLAIVTVAAAAAPVAAAAPGPPGAVAASAVVAEKAPAPVPPSGATAAPPPPPPAYQVSDTTRVLGQCTAIYDYDATDEDQIDIKEGDVINIVEKGEDGWWKGEREGKIGLFPASYVKGDMDNDKDNDDGNDQV
ncbi:nostrin-like [Lytechinus pictus]|uniref:nostrin-like n=1 Tax=Lytechinus pictus TaxID=7653 RepID=UPI0030BA2644